MGDPDGRARGGRRACRSISAAVGFGWRSQVATGHAIQRRSTRRAVVQRRTERMVRSPQRGRTIPRRHRRRRRCHRNVDRVATGAGGQRVLLLERRGICSGASGRNAGITGAGSWMHASAADRPRRLRASPPRTFSCLKSLHDEIGQGFRAAAARHDGRAHDARADGACARAVTAKHDAGIDVELIDRDAARSIMPSLTTESWAPPTRGIAATSGRSRSSPAWLTRPRRDGAEIRTGAVVERLARSGDRVHRGRGRRRDDRGRRRRAGHQRLDAAPPARPAARRHRPGARPDPGHPAAAAAPGLPVRDELRQGVRAADPRRSDRLRRLSPARRRRGIGHLPRRDHPPGPGRDRSLPDRSLSGSARQGPRRARLVRHHGLHRRWPAADRPLRRGSRPDDRRRVQRRRLLLGRHRRPGHRPPAQRARTPDSTSRRSGRRASTTRDVTWANPFTAGEKNNPRAAHALADTT